MKQETLDRLQASYELQHQTGHVVFTDAEAKLLLDTARDFIELRWRMDGLEK